jgi:hypothetical protein
LWVVVFASALLVGSGATLARSLAYSEVREPCAVHDSLRRPHFGDLHVHTRFSLDAGTQGTRTSPDQAYEFARGARLGIQPWSEEGDALRAIQLRRPLDFAMVSDHAELIGEVQLCSTPQAEGYRSWQCLVYRHWPRAAYYLFNYMASMKKAHMGLCGENAVRCLAAAKQPWEEMQRAAEAHYDRGAGCEFTTFVGYEWTGMQADAGGNLHRNVVFRNASVPLLPLSFIDGPEPGQLWDGLDAQCAGGEAGCDALVIPHNSNLSAGFMFSGYGDSGSPMSRAYAEQRQRYEPLMEIMQHKGASECFFSAGVTADELCAFEQLPEDNIAGFNRPPSSKTGFLRQVLSDGLVLRQTLGVNPYRLGVIASTDTHLGAPGAVAEDRFPGHGGAGIPAAAELPPGLPDKLEYNPGGVAVIWAEENSRDALFNAMRRREVYGTSGPRIVSRFFGGWNYPDDWCSDPDRLARAYEGGVPMGGQLVGGDAGESAPVFLLAANQDSGTRDYPGAPLQRIQLVKGWVDEAGEHHQRVMDVAGDAGNGAAVDPATCQRIGAGSPTLCAVWRDDQFNPRHSAWYYSRVVENPSCRWSQRLCVAAGVDCNQPAGVPEGYEDCCAADHRRFIQERAWSSPIWYHPAR